MMGVGDQATRHPDLWASIGLSGPSGFPGVEFWCLAPACVQTTHAGAPRIAHFCTFRHVAPHTQTRHPGFWASGGLAGPSRLPGVEFWCLARACGCADAAPNTPQTATFGGHAHVREPLGRSGPPLGTHRGAPRVRQAGWVCTGRVGPWKGPWRRRAGALALETRPTQRLSAAARTSGTPWAATARRTRLRHTHAPNVPAGPQGSDRPA